MKRFESVTKPLMWFMALFLAALAAGCGGSAILGGGGTGITPTIAPVNPPTVTAVAPLDTATGVPTNYTIITAAFSEPVTPITGGASFTVTCAASCVNPTGTVALDATKKIATFASAANLAPLTLYTATITGVQSLATGLTLASPYVWSFTTGIAPDTTKPRVTLTVPATTVPGPTVGAPTNTAVTAVFSEDMAPATITAASFTLTGPGGVAVPVSGIPVAYTVGSRTATFTPAAALASNTTYTATITTAATDLAGNPLAGNPALPLVANNYVWAFTTAVQIPAAPVSVLSTNPTNGQAGVSNKPFINATFSVPSGLRMDPQTVNGLTFTVTGPAPALTPVQATSVIIDAGTGRIATFTPLNTLSAGGTYTATLKGGINGVKDVAIPANAMASDYKWSFTIAAVAPPPPPLIPLATVSTFGNFGGSAGMTNTGTTTVINGDIGTTATATGSITGFHDTAGDIYTQTPANIGAVNGTIYTCTVSTTGPTSGAVNASYCNIATQARLDAQTAYNNMAGQPVGGASPAPGGNLAGVTLLPGVYKAPAGSFMIQGGDLTLDAWGNENSSWVFQMATTLLVGGPGAAAPQNVILINGAQAKNVYWQVGSFATINAAGGGTMVGTIISQAGASFSTFGNVIPVTLNGRVLSLGASVTVVDTLINVPAP